MENIQGCPSCNAFENERLPACPLACMLDKCKNQRRPIVNVHHKPVIWILGGPCSGRGTLCNLLKQKYGFAHLSCGDLLRAEVARGSVRAKCFQSVMVRGGLVPNDKILNILREEIKRLEPSSKGFIIDGYPREDHQGPAFEKAISPVSLVINLEISPETMMKRLLACLAATGKPRKDETDRAFKLRIDTFLHYNKRILNQYRDKVYTVNAEVSAEEIFAEVQKYIDPVLDQATKAFAAHTAAITSSSGAKNIADQAKAGPKGLKPTK